MWILQFRGMIICNKFWIMLEIQTILQIFLQIVDVVSDYW